MTGNPEIGVEAGMLLSHRTTPTPPHVSHLGHHAT
jgi:hypothetical protein